MRKKRNALIAEWQIIIKCEKLRRQAVRGEIGMIQFVSFCETQALFGNCGRISAYCIDHAYTSLVMRNTPQMVIR